MFNGMISMDDIFSIIKKKNQVASDIDRVKLNRKSIMNGAKDATFQFPVLVSDTIEIETATAIARIMEKTYAAYTAQWLSLNQTVDITVDRNIQQYLRRFHQNVQLESASISEEEMTKEVDMIESIEPGDTAVITNRSRSFICSFESAKPTAGVYASHKDGLNYRMDIYDTKGFPYVGQEQLVKEDGFEDMSATDFAGQMIAAHNAKAEREAREKMLQQSDKMRAPQISDKDVKKSNDILPYAINVRLTAVNDKDEFVQYLDFILGIKSILHVVNADDMVENLARVLQNKNTLFKFFRWTTGEISLVKNLILNLDDIRDDALARSSGRSPWFGKLKRMKNQKIGVHDFGNIHGLVPNATLVINDYEVDYLERQFGMDIHSMRYASKLVKELFLMALIIVDNGSGTVDILYDGNNQFQTYSLETIQREASQVSNSAALGKEIGRLLGSAR